MAAVDEAGTSSRRGKRVVEDTEYDLSKMLPMPVKKRLHHEYLVLSEMTPLPAKFDFQYSFNCNYWRTVVLVALKVGQRLGTTDIAHRFLSSFFTTFPLALITYLLYPLHVYFIHKKTPWMVLNLNDRRLLLCLAAFLLGVFSSYLTFNWQPSPGLPPPYFIPAVVGLLCEFTGPHFRSYHRGWFLLSTVGVASGVALGIAMFRAEVTGWYLFSLFLAVLFSFHSLQTLIYNMKKGPPDMMEAIWRSLVISLYVTLFDHVVLGKYNGEVAEEVIDKETDIIRTVVF